ncbi:hypothetical protein [Rhodobacteraceae bacterium DSL-40]|uniref:hypothetical protein n=1 Tax=Amaricoccus sp. B4 TaxID=3368557 RepID=UPI000DAE5378
MKTFREVILLFRSLKEDRATRNAFFILLLATVFILTLSVVIPYLAAGSRYEPQVRELLFLAREESLGEQYSRSLSFVSSLAFLIGALTQRSPALFALSVLFAFIWLDDSMQYHERVGTLLSRAFALPSVFGLRSQDSGEILAWLLALIGMTPLFGWAWLRRRAGEAGILAAVVLCFLLLVIFGVVVDMLDVLAPSGSEFLMTNIEDGGEIVVLALVTVIAIGLTICAQAYLEAAAQLTGPETARQPRMAASHHDSRTP